MSAPIRKSEMQLAQLDHFVYRTKDDIPSRVRRTIINIFRFSYRLFHYWETSSLEEGKIGEWLNDKTIAQEIKERVKDIEASIFKSEKPKIETLGEQERALRTINSIVKRLKGQNVKAPREALDALSKRISTEIKTGFLDVELDSPLKAELEKQFSKLSERYLSLKLDFSDPQKLKERLPADLKARKEIQEELKALKEKTPSSSSFEMLKETITKTIESNENEIKNNTALLDVLEREEAGKAVFKEAAAKAMEVHLNARLDAIEEKFETKEKTTEAPLTSLTSLRQIQQDLKAEVEEQQKTFPEMIANINLKLRIQSIETKIEQVIKEKIASLTPSELKVFVRNNVEYFKDLKRNLKENYFTIEDPHTKQKITLSSDFKETVLQGCRNILKAVPKEYTVEAVEKFHLLIEEEYKKWRSKETVQDIQIQHTKFPRIYTPRKELSKRVETHIKRINEALKTLSRGQETYKNLQEAREQWSQRLESSNYPEMAEVMLDAEKEYLQWIPLMQSFEDFIRERTKLYHETLEGYSEAARSLGLESEWQAVLTTLDTMKENDDRLHDEKPPQDFFNLQDKYWNDLMANLDTLRDKISHEPYLYVFSRKRELDESQQQFYQEVFKLSHQAHFVLEPLSRAHQSYLELS